MIFVDDHRPAHVRVLGDGEAKINLDDVDLVWARGMSRSDLRRAMRLVAGRRETGGTACQMERDPWVN